MFGYIFTFSNGITHKKILVGGYVASTGKFEVLGTNVRKDTIFLEI